MPAFGDWIAGSGDFCGASFGLADFARLPCDDGLGQSRFGVQGFTGAFIPGEAGTLTEDMGSGFTAPDLTPLPLVTTFSWVFDSTAFGGRVSSAFMSCLTGNGEGTCRMNDFYDKKS